MAIQLPPDFEHDGAFDAILEARKKPRALTWSEGFKYLQFRRRSAIRRLTWIQLTRRGEVVYRIEGKAGDDLPYPPFAWEAHKNFVKFHQKVFGVFRQAPDPSLGVKARQTKAQLRAQSVLDLYPEYQHRGRDAGGLIAKRLGEPLHYVQRVLRENVHDAKE